MLKRLLACGALVLASMSSALAATDPVHRLHALFDRTWERDLRDDPLSATFYGDKRYDDRWPDLSAAARARSLAADETALAELKRMPRERLLEAERLNFDLFQRLLEDRITEAPFHPEAYAIGVASGVQTLNEVAENLDLSSVAAYEAWLQRLRSLPRYLDQQTELLREAMRSGRTQPRLSMERVLPRLQAHLVDTPQASPFFSAFRQMPPSLLAAQRERLQAEAARTISEHVIPAYRRFEAFFRTEYLPACRESVGLWDTPDGAAYYAWQVRHHTTTALTPDEIHELGLKEVARIHGEMRQLMTEVGFQGGEPAFFDKLRNDPQFYFSSPDELFRAYVVAAKLIEPELPKLFGKLYRTPFGVRPIPDTSAPNTTTAYYNPPSLDGRRAGYYYVNLYKPQVRPKWEVEVLTAHESVPGHHLQIALAQELGDLPLFRRYMHHTAFVEGWGLYSERLGYDLGLYKDPYSRFGQLTYDMWRAVRLVVDTGLHHRRWTRQQAIDYFKANAPKTETDIVNEVDRYIGWPGQALAYKIGQLKLLELRAFAQSQLGERFDLRGFHDQVLGSGALPLSVLERQVKEWVALQQRQKLQPAQPAKTPAARRAPARRGAHAQAAHG